MSSGYIIFVLKKVAEITGNSVQVVHNVLVQLVQLPKALAYQGFAQIMKGIDGIVYYLVDTPFTFLLPSELNQQLGTWLESFQPGQELDKSRTSILLKDGTMLLLQLSATTLSLALYNAYNAVMRQAVQTKTVIVGGMRYVMEQISIAAVWVKNGAVRLTDETLVYFDGGNWWRWRQGAAAGAPAPAEEEEAVPVVQLHNLPLSQKDLLPTAEGEQRITDQELLLIPTTRENFEVWFFWHSHHTPMNSLTRELSDKINEVCYGQIVVNRIGQHIAMMGGLNVD